MPKRVLIIVAAPAEAAAVLRGMRTRADEAQEWTVIEAGPSADLVRCGVGKSNAAGATARFADADRHRAILSVGIAGALPAGGLAIGSVVAAGACAYADEGIVTPEGFLDCGQMGFPLGDFPGREVPVDAGVLEMLRPIADRVGTIATVSTCSGTDALAADVVARTGAIAEAMEGAAVVHAARRLGIPGGELRVISNTTGDRARQIWDIRGALDRLSSVLGHLASRF